MDNRPRNTDLSQLEITTVQTHNKLLRASFSWMALAMLLTAIAAYAFASVPELLALLQHTDEFGRSKPTLLAYAVMFAPLIFVMVMTFRLERLSFPALAALFVAYAVVNGISFSFIFQVYSLGAITKVFLSTTALFGIMAVAGYSTRTDLTKLGSLLFIGLIGIVIASLINLFMGSATMDYVISILGVIVFTGLTAYDVQKIKRVGEEAGASSETARFGIMGALTLYLDFINLFLFLLRLFGGRRD